MSAENLDLDSAFAGRVDAHRAPFSLPTVAASAPVLVQLSEQMRRVRDDTDDPAVRDALGDVLAGRSTLSALLAGEVLPPPPAEIPPELQNVIDSEEDVP